MEFLWAIVLPWNEISRGIDPGRYLPLGHPAGSAAAPALTGMLWRWRNAWVAGALGAVPVPHLASLEKTLVCKASVLVEYKI